jgi:1,4-alpha-glucan branching enzyme
MGITKKYLPDGEFCRVTFTLPTGHSKTAETATIVGDFNEWDTRTHPMKRRKNGQFAISLDLKTNNEYQFRYLLDGNNWVTDLKSDALEPTGFHDQYNSVVKL